MSNFIVSVLQRPQMTARFITLLVQVFSIASQKYPKFVNSGWFLLLMDNAPLQVIRLNQRITWEPKRCLGFVTLACSSELSEPQNNHLFWYIAITISHKLSSNLRGFCLSIQNRVWYTDTIAKTVWYNSFKGAPVSTTGDKFNITIDSNKIVSFYQSIYKPSLSVIYSK